MAQWFIEITTNWSDRTWLGFWAFCLSALALICSRFQKHFEKERFKIFTEAESLTAEEQQMCLADEAKFNAWYDELTADDKTRIRQYRGFLKECRQLKKKHLGKRYFEQLAALNNGLQRFIGDKLTPIETPQNTWQKLNNKAFGIDPFTVWSYPVCLLFAFGYPFVLALGSWVITGTLQLGNVVLGEGDDLGVRLATIAVLVVMGYLGVKGVKGVKTSKLRGQIVYVSINLGLALMLVILSRSEFAFAFTLAITAVVALASFSVAAGVAAGFAAITIAIAIGIAIAFVYVFVDAIADAVVVAVAAVGPFAAVGAAVALMFSISNKNTRSKKAILMSLGTLFLVPLYVTLVLYFMINLNGLTNFQLSFILVIILLGILPFTNAIVDWVSLSVTRGLLFKLQHSRHSWFKGLVFVLVDVGLALFFIAVVTAITLAALGGVNSFIGKSVIDFSQLMVDVTNPEKFTDTLWLHLMLFSTILPTLLHLGFALYALLLGYGRPNIEKWIDDLPRASGIEREKAYFYTLRTRVWALIGVMMIAFGLLWLLSVWQQPLWWLWDWADTVLNAVDSSYTTPNFAPVSAPDI